MSKVNIRSDLSIGDQKIGAKMNTNGLWTISEVTVCGLPTADGIKEIGQAMMDLNKKIDLANEGREPPKKKVVKKPLKEPSEKVKKVVLKLPKKSEEKKAISGGVEVKPEGEKKGKLFG